jgi:hypothetical protein
MTLNFIDVAEIKKKEKQVNEENVRLKNKLKNKYAT